MLGLFFDLLDALDQRAQLVGVEFFQALDAAQVGDQFVDLAGEDVPADAHLVALAVGDHHPARFADGLFGHPKQTGLHLGGDEGLVRRGDHLIKEERLQGRIGLEHLK